MHIAVIQWYSYSTLYEERLYNLIKILSGANHFPPVCLIFVLLWYTQLNAPLYVVHVMSKSAAQVVQRAKDRGE